jgi:toxin ParE1/3/4
MPYLVELTTRAVRDLESIYEEIRATESPAAGRWFNGLESAILTLEEFPRRNPMAPEAETTKRPLRQLFYGKKPDVYRLIYEIDEPLTSVRVITIRHGARDRARPTDLR